MLVSWYAIYFIFKLHNLRFFSKLILILVSVYFSVSSASEVSDNDSDDSVTRELSGYACRHCYTTSEYKIETLNVHVQVTHYHCVHTLHWVMYKIG